MKFVQLILSNITKIVATSFEILRLKCTKFDFGWGSTQIPPALHGLPSWIWVELLRGEEKEGNVIGD